MYSAIIPPSDAQLSPPRGFRGARGVSVAQIVTPDEAPWRGRKAPGSTLSQKAGKLYEKKVLARLKDWTDGTIYPLPWIKFRLGNSDRYCQPDALIHVGNTIVIVEVKLTHTLDAYWQLRRLYYPVVSTLFPGTTIRLCEVAKNMRPEVKYLEPIALTRDLQFFAEQDDANIGVIPWKS